MTVKQEYEKMKAELRSWNKRSNFDETKYAYRIEHYTKKSKQMFLKLLNSDFEKMNFDIKYGFISTDEYNELWKVWNDCSRSISIMKII